MTFADEELIIKGKAGSDVNVSWREPFAVEVPSVSVSKTPKLPSAATVPEIRPVVELMLSPDGRPLAATLAAEVILLAVI